MGDLARPGPWGEWGAGGGMAETVPVGGGGDEASDQEKGGSRWGRRAERHGPRPSPGASAWGQEGKKPTRERRAGGAGACGAGGAGARPPAFTVTSTLGVQYG